MVCFFLTIFIFSTRGITDLLCYFGFVLLVFLVSQLSLSIAFRNLKPFYLLFLLTVGLHSFFTPGMLLLKFPVLHIQVTREGLYHGFFYSFRIGLLILIASLLTLTTSPMSLTDAIENFLKPFRKIGIPAHEIALMISISLRFIPTLIEEADRIRKAQISRGSRFDGSLFRRIQSVIPIIIPLFISTFRRANDLAVAMDARCYRGGVGRTQYFVLKYRPQDYIALSIVLMVGIGLILAPFPQILKVV